MAGKKYIFDPHNLQIVEVVKGFKYYLSRLVSFLISSVAIGIIFAILFSYFVDSPKEARLKRENTRLLSQYEILSQKLDQVEDVLDDIQLRDENIYRVIYQADSIPNVIRKAGFGGVNRYTYLENLDNSAVVIETAKKLDIIMKQMYVQSNSFDEIIGLTLRKEEMVKCVPSIPPISSKNLIKTASGYGVRLHPIYKTHMFHTGMDFPAPTGTEVYATGDGVIDLVETSKSGYGNQIVINHGFGYSTVYAHLSAFKVHQGKKVKRGDLIGEVGSTGRSTGSHLHYEVRIKGVATNPVNYYFNDLNEQEYEELVTSSSNNNRIFD